MRLAAIVLIGCALVMAWYLMVYPPPEAGPAAGPQSDPAATAVAISLVDQLKPESFDMARVVRLIDASAIGDAQKRVLKVALEANRNDPEKLAAVLQRVLTALSD